MFTIIGAGGFIGGALTKYLQTLGHDVFAPTRMQPDLFERALGHVIYAAGVTADFRTRPFDTLSAHTTYLAEVLQRGKFESMLYLSSARVYRHAAHGAEHAAIPVHSDDPEDFYDITKLAGEALCHSFRAPELRVARLTNVVGPDFGSRNFIFDLMRSACDVGHVELRSSLDSAKDYVLLEDVLQILPRLSQAGQERCYNIGGGRSIAHREILASIVDATGASFSVVDNAPPLSGPHIDISRVQHEFGFSPVHVLPKLPALIQEYRASKHDKN